MVVASHPDLLLAARFDKSNALEPIKRKDVRLAESRQLKLKTPYRRFPTPSRTEQ